jgi:VIT1/CCC1 family predicted Fe2+/Mn2+ transporter
MDSALGKEQKILRRPKTAKRGQSSTLRAAVLGINEGLISNFSLVMGVAGAALSSRFVLLAGMAGLLAGAFFMAAGEYVSMSSQRELFENQIAIERRKHEEDPDAERRELALICQKHGIPSKRRGPWQRP